MIQVKICGVTRLDDAVHAATCGADLVGFVFAPSPRRADPDIVRQISQQLMETHPQVARVGVFLNPTEEEVLAAAGVAQLTHLQIHGSVPRFLPKEFPWIAAIGLTSPEEVELPKGNPWAVLVEPRSGSGGGGTGRRFPWEWVRPLLPKGRIFIAGGLDAGRIPELLRMVRPFGVDASSGLEIAPGVKDPHKVRSFIDTVRREETRMGEAL